jgi:hypothetical protein
VIASGDDEVAGAARDSSADSVQNAVRHAEELMDDGEVRAAREAIEAAIEENSRPISPDLLWVLADIEFADGDPEKGARCLRDAADLNGNDSESVSRQIRTLSRNRLRRDALRIIESLGPGLRYDPLVREAIGGFFRARGCYTHAVDGYGQRAGLSSAKRTRRLVWLASGGPFPAIRNRMREWEESQLIRRLQYANGYLRCLDQVVGINDQLRAQLKARIENVSYVFNLRFAMYQAFARWMMRLSPIAALLGWLVLFLIVSSVHFISGSGGTAWGSAVSAAVVLAAALGTALVALASLSLGFAYIFRLTWRKLVIFVAIVALFETAIAEAYDHHGLPATGWWSWIVFGLAAAPVVAACGMGSILLGNALAWSHAKGPYRADCIAALLDTALRILDGFDDPVQQRNQAVRLRWAVELEDAASLLTKNLIPPSYLRYLSSRDWLTQRMTGWAEALYHLQRQILAPNSGSQREAQSILRHEIKCLATGDLGTLAWRRPPARPPRRVTARRQAVAAVRALVVAALPLAAVLATQPVLHISTPVFNWARIAAGIWALLYVVITLDPAIRDKIDTARSLAGTLRSSQSLTPPGTRDG